MLIFPIFRVCLTILVKVLVKVILITNSSPVHPNNSLFKLEFRLAPTSHPTSSGCPTTISYLCLIRATSHQTARKASPRTRRQVPFYAYPFSPPRAGEPPSWTGRAPRRAGRRGPGTWRRRGRGRPRPCADWAGRSPRPVWRAGSRGGPAGACPPRRPPASGAARSRSRCSPAAQVSPAAASSGRPVPGRTAAYLQGGAELSGWDG